jgi:hypothetical protein
MEWKKGTFLICKVLGLALALKSAASFLARSGEFDSSKFRGILAGKIPEEFLTRHNRRVCKVCFSCITSLIARHQAVILANHLSVCRPNPIFQML